MFTEQTRNRQPLAPYVRQRTLDNSVWFMGSLFTFPATSEQTGGLFSLMDVTVRKGIEIPPHTHTRDDESFYILEGEVLCRIEGQEYRARPGELVFLPRHRVHT